MFLPLLPSLVFLLVPVSVIFGVFGAVVTIRKDRGWVIGALLGFFLLLPGLVLALLVDKSARKFRDDELAVEAALRPTHRDCPWCRELMGRDESYCSYCRRNSDPWRLHDGKWWTRSASGDFYWWDEDERKWSRPGPGTSVPGVA